MNRFLICILLVVLFCNSTSAQLRRTRRKPTPAEIAKLNKQHEQYLKETKGETFENFKFIDRGTNMYRAKIESLIVRKGDSVRMRYVFRVGSVVRIAVKGGGVTTPKDIQKGVFLTKVFPPKTMWVEDHIDIVHPVTGEVSTERYGWRVIVVEPEKYDSIKAIYDKLPEGRERYRFTDSLAGGTLRDFREGKIK